MSRPEEFLQPMWSIFLGLIWKHTNHPWERDAFQNNNATIIVPHAKHIAKFSISNIGKKSPKKYTYAYSWYKCKEAQRVGVTHAVTDLEYESRLFDAKPCHSFKLLLPLTEVKHLHFNGNGYIFKNDVLKIILSSSLWDRWRVSLFSTQ